MKKNLILTLVAFIFILLGVFVFMDTTTVVPNDTKAATSTSTQTQEIPALTWPTEKQTAQGILPYSTTTGMLPFSSLTSYEKLLVNRFAEQYPATYSTMLELANNNEELAKSYLILRYYDKDTVVFSIPNGKAAHILEIYNIDTLEKTSKAYFALFGYHVETKNFIIVADGENKFMYYKIGAKEFATAQNSKLTPTTETYVKVGGFYNEAEFTFDEKTKTISASVFKPVFKEGVENPKVRTATFVLP